MRKVSLNRVNAEYARLEPSALAAQWSQRRASQVNMPKNEANSAAHVRRGPTKTKAGLHSASHVQSGTPALKEVAVHSRLLVPPERQV